MRKSAYRRIGPLYDVLSGEWPVYRAGRVAGIEALRLRPGMRVLDVGCGTGLNFGLLDAVGPTGAIVGLDASAGMLAQARRREVRAAVELIEADATQVTPAALGTPFDAVIATYSLSLMPDWPLAWATMLAACRPGARIVVVDMQRPTGAARVLTPLALAACAMGGSDIDAHPWTAVEGLADGFRHGARGGHIQVRGGTV